MKSKKAKEDSIVLSLKNYDSSGRHKVIPCLILIGCTELTFMRAGVLISKLEYFRDIVEDNTKTNRTMFQLVHLS